MCSHLKVYPSFLTNENPGFVELIIFPLFEGKKVKCEVILPRNEMSAVKLLSIVFTKVCLFMNAPKSMLGQYQIFNKQFTWVFFS